MNILLFMTRGMSLAAWRDNGSIERELALYAGLAQRGHSIGIISWGGPEDRAVAAAYPWLRVYVNRFNLPQGRYEKLMPLLHALPLARADLIKSNQTNGADCALRCARFWGKPFISRCGYIWSEFCKEQQSSELEQARQIEREVFSGCGQGIVTTAAAKDYLISEYGISEAKINVLPNYVPDGYYLRRPSIFLTGNRP